MPTFLSKLFKPKWQSKAVATRLEAVSTLDANSEEEQGILIILAKSDLVASVRSAAIAKLNNGELLIDMHKTASDDTKPAIEQRLYELANAQSLTIFDLILDPNLLSEMIIKSDQPEAFITGLARIEDPAALLAIARSSKTSKVRQAAAELLETEQQLLDLASFAKSKDKSVYQIVKAKLAQIKEQNKARKARQAVIDKSLQSIDDLVRTENNQHYQAKLTALNDSWLTIEQDATEQQKQHFDAANGLCLDKQQALLATIQEKEEAQHRLQTGGDEQEATLLILSETLARFKLDVASPQELSALDALLKTQEVRWLEATRQIQVEKSQNKRYQQLMTEMRRYYNALKLTSENSSTIDSIIADISRSENNSTKLSKLTSLLANKLQEIDWPEAYSQPPLLQKITASLGHSAGVKQQQSDDIKQTQQKFIVQLEALDTFLDDRQVMQSTKIYKNLQTLLSKIPSKQSETFQQNLGLRLNQLNELRDWKGYASHPRQQELCEAMTRLSELHMEPRDKAEKIKAMQKEWKGLGGAADKSLWLKFKTASDKAYEPCKAFFDEQDQLKESNSEKRAMLITQLEMFIEKNDWQNADWKASEQINRKARIEWKEAHPVNFKTNKVHQRQFNDLLKKLDQHLDQERETNLAKKNAIVEKAKELIAMNDLDQAIRQAKSLQNEWQNIGITPYKQDRMLWKAYREACDQVFARRDQEKKAVKAEVEQATKSADQFCVELENLTKNTDKELHTVTSLSDAISKFQRGYKSLPSLHGRPQEKIQARFESGIKQLKKALQHAENQQRIMQWREAQRKSDICRRYYTDVYIEKQNNAAFVNDPQKQNALEKEFESLIDLSKALETSFKSLWISLKAGALKQSLIIDTDEARELCIRCEIAAGLESPSQDKELRMQLQVSRLSEGISSRAQQLSREEQLANLLADWYQKVGLSVDDFKAMEQRIIRTSEHLFG